jgi:hypothetical protein
MAIWISPVGDQTAAYFAVTVEQPRIGTLH